MKKYFENGNIFEAQKIQKEANRIIKILCDIGVMQAEKEVLNQLGMDFGICRHPFGEPTAEQKKLIGKEIIPFIPKEV
ncbi:MAG: dihydrodipicolinate synthase family protein [Clostridia bacterium]|nr:dihydrodipicolinate synthase family protein [Clostridia bacterium]